MDGYHATCQDICGLGYYEWLSEGNQPHDHIFIFDFWNYAAESDPNPENGIVSTLKFEYERSRTYSDSHPTNWPMRPLGQFLHNSLSISLNIQVAEE